ncbi:MULTISPECIES: hypothetical protein [unclassified Sphingomonas]|uniref:hypothetical protein n=1 Tax=unclassified Sphingomonas TaxID=196159 RepID=UPI002269A4E2|nr:MULTISPECIES: hypothetical protein [unclassified Sphingomonas]
MLEAVGANAPATNKPSRRVTVEKADGSWSCFEIPLGCDPPIDATITWGPHHAWWDGHKVTKGWDRDPNAPLT